MNWELRSGEIITPKVKISVEPLDWGPPRKMNRACDEALDQIMNNHNRVKKLEAGLRQYGFHYSGCKTKQIDGCDCGFAALFEDGGQ